MVTILIWIMCIICITIGVLGVILPALPGSPLVLAGLFILAWADGFHNVGWVTLIVLGLMTLISVGIDLIFTTLGVKRTGASKVAIAGAVLGTIIGLFFGIAGIIIGPFAGAFIGELLYRKNLIQAGKAGIGAWIGIVLGTAAKLALVFAMIGTFIVDYFFLH